MMSIAHHALARILQAAWGAALLGAPPSTGQQGELARKLLFENEHVRVEHAVIPARYAGAMHSHERPALEIFLTDDHVRETLPDGTAREWKARMNEVAWIAPLRHRVESLRPAATEIVVIEFKSLPPAARKVATSPSAPVYENEWIKVTHGKLGPKEKGPVHTHPMYIGVFLTAANLRATLADGTVREITGKRGDASWRAPVTHSIENLADTPFEAIDVNFKTVRGGR